MQKNSQEDKNEPQIGRKYFQNIYYIKQWYPKYTFLRTLKIQQLENKQSNFKMTTNLNKHHTKEGIQMSNKLLQRYPTSALCY